MALFADDIQRLRSISDRTRTAYAMIGQTHYADDDADFLRELSDRILHELSEPTIFSWPWPEDEPEEHP